MPNPKNKTKGILVILLVLLAIIGIFCVGVIPRMLYLMPGPEGLQVGTWGFQPDSTILASWGTNEVLPTPFRWGQQPVDPYNTLILRDPQAGEYPPDHRGIMLIERQQPYPDTGTASRQITYFVKISENETNIVWKKIVGVVVPWVFTMQISLRPQDLTFYAWRNHAVWLAMGTVKWNRAYNDPDDPSKSSDAGYSIPLCAYIEHYDATGGGWVNDDKVTKRMPDSSWIQQCCILTPDFSGRTVTLYSDPESAITLDDLWYTGMSGQPCFDTLNSSTYPSTTPDTKFKNSVYFRFTFTDFRPYLEYNLGVHVETWYPSVLYRFRIYYLELGEFTYIMSKDEIPEWENRGWAAVFMPAYYLIDGICKFLNVLNPFSVFGPYAGLVAFIFLLFVVFVVIIALLAIFAPWALSRLTGGLAKAKHSWDVGRKGG